MSLALPVTGSALRELFRVEDLVAITTGEQALPCKAAAIRSAKRTMSGNRAIRSVVVFALDSSNDEVGLYKVGPRGGHKRLWVFGPVPRTARLA